MRLSAFPVRRRVAIVAVIAAASLAVLSACAPSTATATHHTVRAHHSAGASSSATPSPTPTPTVAALTPPKVRIPLTCAQVAPSAQLNSVLENTMTLQASEQPLPDLTSYAAIEDGALNCLWYGPGGNETTYQILAMPDATSYWNKYAANGGLGEALYPSSFVGANAYGNCSSDSTDTPQTIGCNLDIMVGSTWLSISGYANVHSAPSTSQVQADFKPLFTNAINELKGVTVAEPQWSDPAATATSLPGAMGVVTQTTFQTAIGREYAIEVDQPDVSLAGAQIAEFLPVNFRLDAGSGTGAGQTVTPATNYGMSLDVLPSGSWAYMQIVHAVDGNPGFTTLSGLGTSAVTYSLGSTSSFGKDNAIIIGTVGEHLYSVVVGTPGTAGTPDAVTLAKAAAGYIVKELTP